MGYALVVDSIDYSIWVMFLLWLITLASRFNVWNKADTTQLDAVSRSLEEDAKLNTGKITFQSIILLLGAALVVSAVGANVGKILNAAVPFFDKATWTILFITVLGLIGAVSPLLRDCPPRIARLFAGTGRRAVLDFDRVHHPRRSFCAHVLPRAAFPPRYVHGMCCLARQYRRDGVRTCACRHLLRLARSRRHPHGADGLRDWYTVRHSRRAYYGNVCGVNLVSLIKGMQKDSLSACLIFYEGNLPALSN